MSKEAYITGIYISPVPQEIEKPKGGEKMLAITFAKLVAGHGIMVDENLKDRYFGAEGETLKGAYPNNKIRQLTIITQDAINRANENEEIEFLPEETRRNIIVEGITAEELNDQVGKIFTINGIKVRGVELCAPCDRPDKLSGKKGFKSRFTNSENVSIGGIRVEILDSGFITKADLFKTFQ